MTGRKTPSPAPRLAFAFAALVALGGPVAAGHAETEIESASFGLQQQIAERADQTFTPSEEAQFEESFAHLAAISGDPVVPDHAVDISTVEPASETEARDIGSGVASYYGRRFAGRLTANGERFDPAEMTAAHKTLPFGSRVRVTNPRNGEAVIVRINDRGPYAHGRTIDLSRAAAEQIGLIQRGHGTVELALLEG